MKSVPRFLMMLLISLLFGAGCHHPTNSGATKMAKKAKKPLEKANKAKKKPPGSEYEELVTDSPIARYMRGQPQKMAKKEGHAAFICLASGLFKFGDKPDHLPMQTMCVEQEPVAGQGLHIRIVDDKPAPLVKGESNVYRIPFEYALISVVDYGGAEPEVTLHYRDAKKVIHHVTLPPILGEEGKEYRYSFAHLAKSGVLVPIGDDIRMLPL